MKEIVAKISKRISLRRYAKYSTFPMRFKRKVNFRKVQGKGSKLKKKKCNRVCTFEVFILKSFPVFRVRVVLTRLLCTQVSLFILLANVHIKLYDFSENKKANKF